MKKTKWLNLQLFADGGEGQGTSGGSEAGSGDANSVDAGQQRLLELGVPADKIRNRAKKTPVVLPEGAVRTAPKEPPQDDEQVAAAQNPTEEEKSEDLAPARMSWDEIMADPEYNKQMQAVVQSRLKNAKAAEDSLAKLTPALELLAKHHNLNAESIDYEALAKAINDDHSYYEQKAVEMGVSVETAMKIDQQERAEARRQREEAKTLEERKIQQHFQRLVQQGEDLKKAFPGFDLRKELQNPAFARMTAPNVGISVEDAYYAVHRSEIQETVKRKAAQETAEKISNSIQAGQRRPDENGASGQAPSVIQFDYRTASPEQRAALKKRIMDAAGRGEKVYPGI